MKLREFLFKNEISIVQFACDCGLSFHKVYHIKTGHTPTLATACVVERKTGGAVRFRDMLSDKDAEKIYGEDDEKH